MLARRDFGTAAPERHSGTTVTLPKQSKEPISHGYDLLLKQSIVPGRKKGTLYGIGDRQDEACI